MRDKDNPAVPIAKDEIDGSIGELYLPFVEDNSVVDKYVVFAVGGVVFVVVVVVVVVEVVVVAVVVVEVVIVVLVTVLVTMSPLVIFTSLISLPLNLFSEILLGNLVEPLFLFFLGLPPGSFLFSPWLMLLLLVLTLNCFLGWRLFLSVSGGGSVSSVFSVFAPHHQLTRGFIFRTCQVHREGLIRAAVGGRCGRRQQIFMYNGVMPYIYRVSHKKQ